MKIIKITSFYSPVTGGMETHMLNESKELIKLGHQVSIYTSNSKRKGKLNSGKTIEDQIEINRFKTWFRLSYFTPFFPGVFLKSIFDNYDVLHSHSYRQTHNLTIIIAKLRNKKAILSTHWPEYPKELRSGFMNFFIPLFDKTLGKLILKFADHMIVQSEQEKKWLINKFKIKEDKIKIIEPGIEEKYLKIIKPGNFKTKFKIKNRFILSLGRIHPSKGIDKLITIAPKINATIVIAGSGEYLNKLKEKAYGIKNIIFTGRITEEEKIEGIKDCEIYVTTSNYEAFGITLIEAMAQGKPVIGSNVGGIPETIGNGGLIFNKDNLEELIKKINLLLKDKKLRKSLGNNGLKKAKELTWPKIAKRISKVYISK